MKFIKNTMPMIRCSVFNKTPHPELLRIISQKTGTDLSKDNVIYISGLK